MLTKIGKKNSTNSWQMTNRLELVRATLERWIGTCSDADKVWIALNQDAYPFIDHSIRIQQLSKVMTAFPLLRASCEAMLAQTQRWMCVDREPKKDSP
ncbi:hypothetical protein G3N57_06110 [Paraburkholderia sp. Se-20369]|nr:hypothetical protein [Paraburkholderia sp. Se-20369]